MGKMEERLICAVCLKFEADTLPHLEEHWAVHFKHYLPDSDEEDEGDDDDAESAQGIYITGLGFNAVVIELLFDFETCPNYHKWPIITVESA